MTVQIKSRVIQCFGVAIIGLLLSCGGDGHKAEPSNLEVSLVLGPGVEQSAAKVATYVWADLTQAGQPGVAPLSSDTADWAPPSVAFSHTIPSGVFGVDVQCVALDDTDQVIGSGAVWEVVLGLGTTSTTCVVRAYSLPPSGELDVTVAINDNHTIDELTVFPPVSSCTTGGTLSYELVVGDAQSDDFQVILVNLSGVAMDLAINGGTGSTFDQSEYDGPYTVPHTPSPLQYAFAYTAEVTTDSVTSIYVLHSNDEYDHGMLVETETLCGSGSGENLTGIYPVAYMEFLYNFVPGYTGVVGIVDVRYDTDGDVGWSCINVQQGTSNSATLGSASLVGVRNLGDSDHTFTMVFSDGAATSPGEANLVYVLNATTCTATPL